MCIFCTVYNVMWCFNICIKLYFEIFDCSNFKMGYSSAHVIVLRRQSSKWPISISLLLLKNILQTDSMNFWTPCLENSTQFLKCQLSLLFLNFASLGHNFFQGPDHLGPIINIILRNLKLSILVTNLPKNIDKIFVWFFYWNFLILSNRWSGPKIHHHHVGQNHVFTWFSTRFSLTSLLRNYPNQFVLAR